MDGVRGYIYLVMTTDSMVCECEEKGSGSVEDAYAKGKEAGNEKEGACPDSTLDRLLNEPKLTVLRARCVRPREMLF